MHLHLDDPITMDKLRKAVKAANIGKAPGLDGIADEVIKHGLLQQLLSVKCTRSNCLRRSKAGLTAHLRRATRNTGANYSRLSQHQNRYTGGEVEH